MNTSQTKRIGTHHINNCEDATGIYDVGQSRILLLIADGCSMGNNSYFASQLLNLLIKQIAKEEFYQEYNQTEHLSVETLLKRVFSSLFKKLSSAANLLGASEADLLSTLGIALIDTDTLDMVSLFIGDGSIVVDGALIDYDQENMPDYIGYHLGENFEEWYGCQNQFHTASGVSDVCLITDGLYTFADKYDERLPTSEAPWIINVLLNTDNKVFSEHLRNNLDYLQKEHWLTPTDDIGVVRWRGKV